MFCKCCGGEITVGGPHEACNASIRLEARKILEESVKDAEASGNEEVVGILRRAAELVSAGPKHRKKSADELARTKDESQGTGRSGEPVGQRHVIFVSA